ncbi:MOSC domain-containing protein [Clostridium sp. Cult1]|uniref:MOSC domain-containing protein n=1 Tax=Clostridium sp. Cult1 TaxID=2079002 RepID=UPI001F1B42D7|nr:MOSC domain-containing protein [Clostridium sp. Cult1]MCF6463490.1 MOSC domain-containing protein [Clostridium sp. Cult1]
MEVKSLFIKREKGGNIERIEEGFFKREKGLVGDINGIGGDRQVSIATSRVRKYIEEGKSKGICVKRFYENITIEGLNIEELSIGQRVIIGETIQEITHMGKRCFPECNLFISNNPCPLFKEVLFTRVLKDGIVKAGDKVGIMNYNNTDDGVR